MAKKNNEAVDVEIGNALFNTAAKKRHVVIAVGTHGQVGNSTEIKGAVEFLFAAGYDPVLISAETEGGQYLKETYGQRDANDKLLTGQDLGVGVVEFDLTKKDQTLHSFLSNKSIHHRPIVIDMKGGTFDSLSGGMTVDDFFDLYEDSTIFSFVICCESLDKGFQNLDRFHNFFSQHNLDTEINLCVVFSSGKIGEAHLPGIKDKYFSAWKPSHPLPGNITYKEFEFNTKFSTAEHKKFFATAKIRSEWTYQNGGIQILAVQFLKERDKAWSKVFFSPEEIIALSQQPDPTRNDPSKLWGRVLN